MISSRYQLKWGAHGWRMNQSHKNFIHGLEILKFITEQGVAIAHVEFAPPTYVIVDLVFPPIHEFYRMFTREVMSISPSYENDFEGHKFKSYDMVINPLIPGDAGEVTLEQCLYVPVTKMLSIINDYIEQEEFHTYTDTETLERHAADLIRYKAEFTLLPHSGVS